MEHNSHQVSLQISWKWETSHIGKCLYIILKQTEKTEETLLTPEWERKPWKSVSSCSHIVPLHTALQEFHGLNSCITEGWTQKWTLPQLVKSHPCQLCDHVASRQKATKTCTDAKQGAKVPRIKKGILVQVRKPFHVKDCQNSLHLPK